MEPGVFYSWMISTARSEEEFYAEGKRVFGKGAPDLSVVRYGKAIKLCKPDTAVTEKALYFASRAQAHIRLKEYLKAEVDSLCAVRLIADKPHASYELETALYGQWLTLIEEWQEALSEAKDEGTYSPSRIRTLLEQLEPLVDKIDSDLSRAPRPRPPLGQISRSAVLSLPADLDNPTEEDITVVPFSSSESALAAHFETIHSAHNALSVLWEEKKEELVAAWKRMPEEPDRLFLCADASNGMFEGPEDWDRYPELDPGILYQQNNLLDFIFSRATRSPAVAAYHLDLPAAASYKVGAASLSSLTLHEDAPSLMYLDEDPYGQPYGSVLPSSHPGLSSLLTNSQACPLPLGNAVLERQRLTYLIALRSARLLFFAASNPDLQRDWRRYPYGVNAREYLRRFSFPWEFKARLYIGREEWKDGRTKMESLLNRMTEKAEEHVEKLKYDTEYAYRLLLDSVPSEGGRVQLNEARGALRRLILNAHARHLLAQEIDGAFSSTYGYPKNIGTSPSIPLPPSYERKLGTFLNLVDEYVEVMRGDFKASVKGNYGYFAEESLDELELHYADLEHLFRKAARIDPLGGETSTWELLAVFGYIEQHVEYSEEPDVCNAHLRIVSSEIPSPLREIWLGFPPLTRVAVSQQDYRDILRIRELLLDSHRPRFNREKANPSEPLKKLSPLLPKLKSSFDDSVALPTVQRFLLRPSSSLHESILNSFSDKIESTLGDSVDNLFEALRSDLGEELCSDLEYESSETEESEVDSLELPPLEEVEVEDAAPTPPHDTARSAPPSTSRPPPSRSLTAPVPHQPSPYDADDRTLSGGAKDTATVPVPQLEERDKQRRRRPLQDVDANKLKRQRRSTEWEAEIAAREAKKEEKKAKEKKPEGIVGQSKRPNLAPDVHFKVSRWACETWQSLLGGGKEVKRYILNQVTLNHLIGALAEAGFTHEATDDGGKLYPGPVLRGYCSTPLSYHRPHLVGGGKFDEDQVMDLGSRLDRLYGLDITRFSIVDLWQEARQAAERRE